MVVTRARDGPGGSRGGWWLVYHGYEHGFRTLGRQVLLEPIEWTDDGWLRATGGDLGRPIRKPVEAAGAGALGVVRSDAFRASTLGSQWTFHSPSRHEQARVVLAEGALTLTAKGTDPSDSSPLVVPTGDRSYEVEVTLDPADAQGGLLLFFNDALFLGMGWDGTTMTTYGGGRRSHFREQVATTGALRLRIRNDEHVVSLFHSPDGSAWTRHGMRFETSGYHANTMSDLQSLRPAIFAAGAGAVEFRDFVYRGLP